MNLCKYPGIRMAVFLVIGFLGGPLQAADSATAPEKPGTSSPLPADPFIKKDAPVPGNNSGPVSNLILTFEIYTLSQTDGAKLLQENETDQARHDRVVKLAGAGQAHLDAVLCGAVMPFQQAKVEQLNTLAYAIAFRGGSGKEVSATDFKNRNVGRRLVLKVSTNPDGQGCLASMFMENTSLRGFSYIKSDVGSGPFDASQPEFSVGRVSTAAASLVYDQIRFLGTYNPMPPLSNLPKNSNPGDKIGEPQMTLAFGKASQLQLGADTRKDAQPSQLELVLSLYSMDRDQALRILNQKQEMDSSYQAVQALVKANQAKLEHLTILRTANGVKSNINEMTEQPYSDGGGGFLTQDVGFSEEMRPAFIGATSFLTIDITQCQLLNDVGHLSGEEVPPYNQTQPLFQLQSLATMINSGLGEHELLGTFSPPENTGVSSQKDDGRVWLAFLRTTAVKP